MKTLTFVTSVYNTKKELLVDCFESINKAFSIDQRIESIIIDNGSNEETKMWLEENYSKPPFILHRIEENKGKAPAIAKAFELVKTKYFQVLDSDDWIDHTKISYIIDVIEKENSDIYFLSYKYHNSKNGKESIRKTIHTKKEIISNFEKVPKFIWHFECNVIRNKETMTKNNFVLPSTLTFYEDVYLNMWLLSYSKKISFINENYYCYRVNQGGTNLSSTTQIARNAKAFEMLTKELIDNVRFFEKNTSKHLIHFLHYQIISYVFWMQQIDGKIFGRKYYKKAKEFMKDNKKLHRKTFGFFLRPRLMNVVLWRGWNFFLMPAGKIVKMVRK